MNFFCYYSFLYIISIHKFFTVNHENNHILANISNKLSTIPQEKIEELLKKNMENICYDSINLNYIHKTIKFNHQISINENYNNNNENIIKNLEISLNNMDQEFLWGIEKHSILDYIQHIIKGRKQFIDMLKCNITDNNMELIIKYTHKQLSFLEKQNQGLWDQPSINPHCSIITIISQKDKKKDFIFYYDNSLSDKL